MIAHEMVNHPRLIHLIGYIGECVAEDYLCNLGFNAYSMGASGMGSRVGDLLIQRIWFHTNGYCEGHIDTFGIEVKTTLSNKFNEHLTPRQAKKHKRNKRSLPLLLVKITKISSHGILYELKEIPETWTSSSYLLDWKESPHRYETNAPRKCHQKRMYHPFSPENLQHYIDYQQKKNIKHLRKNLHTVNYFNIYPFLKANQMPLNKYQPIVPTET